MSTHFLDEKIFAVVGVSNKLEKVGYQIFKYLKDAGKEVYPIHPAIKEIDEITCYNSLSDVPVKVDVVDIVVPPDVTEHIVEECKKLGIKKVWIQPGAESDKAIQFCIENNIEVVHNACIMMPTAK